MLGGEISSAPPLMPRHVVNCVLEKSRKIIKKRKVARSPQRDSCYTAVRYRGGPLLACYSTDERGFILASEVTPVRAQYHCAENLGVLLTGHPVSSKAKYIFTFISCRLSRN